MTITVKFEPRDIWIGAYWLYSKSVESTYRSLRIWICLLPMLPIRLWFEWGWK